MKIRSQEYPSQSCKNSRLRKNSVDELLDDSDENRIKSSKVISEAEENKEFSPEKRFKK